MQKLDNREKRLFFSYQLLLCILKVKYVIKSFASKTGDKLWFVIRAILSLVMFLYKILYIYIYTLTKEPK